jgi:uncharacterized damage-inducible protein DinB
MTTIAPTTTAEIEIFRHQARMIQQVVRLNVDGVTQEQSLIQPRPAGNCINWVVGHLAAIYERVLPLLERGDGSKAEALERYARGAPPLVDAAEAMEIGALMAAFDGATERFDAGLAALSPEALDQAAPFSPSGNPKETVRSLLTVVLFHQGYHSGQTGILRRIAGKEGAIR